VDARGAEQECQRDAAGIDQKVALGAGLAVVGRVGAGALAPFSAGNEALLSEPRPKSIAFARPSRSSKARRSLAQTPAACQFLSRRQQIMPEPQPISLGSLAQGMPMRSMNTMPSSALRSSSGGRPLLGPGGRSGAAARSTPRARRRRAVQPFAQVSRPTPPRGGSVTNS
jgi:hypothetical protein